MARKSESMTADEIVDLLMEVGCFDYMLPTTLEVFRQVGMRLKVHFIAYQTSDDGWSAVMNVQTKEPMTSVEKDGSMFTQPGTSFRLCTYADESRTRTFSEVESEQDTLDSINRADMLITL
eukprot:974279-Rhodomonas_salina.1